MVYTKKAISPVVATALLLVVAVVAVVGFQTWFNTYQSGLNTKVEQQSASGSAVTIERLENGSVYLKNGGTASLTASGVQVNAKSGYTGSCTDPGSTVLNGSQVTTVTLAGCDLTTGSVYNVVVVTTGGVYSAEAIAR
ncbi:MAG: hypothetical protein KC550_03940 [Nanoarchaeota archaeon]|nr:hypothetical protein [Nanoarchaeota archaeon]